MVRSVKVRRRVGIVTEGRGEVASLPELYSQLEKFCGIKLLKPIFADVDPLSSPQLLGKGLSRRVRQAGARGAEQVVVLLDTEQIDICPGERSVEIARVLAKLVPEQVSVVLKHTAFENWLVADPGSLLSQPKLFPNAKKLKISSGSADRANAKRLIQVALGASRFYSKMDHPCKILRSANVDEMQRNSRSFDKFVRTLAV